MKRTNPEIMNGLKLHPKKIIALIAFAFLAVNLLSCGASKPQNNAADPVKSKEKKELKDLSSKELKREAKTNPEAQVLLADGYKTKAENYNICIGNRIEVDNPFYKEAFNLYLKAANANNAKAQYNVGRQILNSAGCYYGSPWLYEHSLLWLNKAADQNVTEAQYELAQIYFYGIKEGGNTMVQRDIEKGMDHYIKAAEKDYAPAQYDLALLYQKSELGYYEKDIDKYKFWMLKAANNNYRFAQDNLAKEMSITYSVYFKQDLEQAMFWVKKILATPQSDGYNSGESILWSVQYEIKEHLRDVEAAKQGAAGIARLAQERHNESLAYDEARKEEKRAFEEMAMFS